MSSRRGIFGALLFATILVMPLTTFNANAQEYIDYNKYNDKNKDYYFYPPKDKKQDPMLVVIKELFVCDSIVESNDNRCSLESIPEPDSDRYLECTGDICDPLKPESFEITIEDKLVFEGSEEGTKINFNGERYTVVEKSDFGDPVQFVNFQCKDAGFDAGIFKIFNILGQEQFFGICTIFEGDCSGILKKGELNECTVKNYIVSNEEPT